MVTVESSDPERVDRLLLDDFMPSWDVTLDEHRVVRADPDRTFRAARELDFLTVRTPLLSTAMWARGFPDRLRGRAPEVPPRLVLGEGAGLPGWVVLGVRPGREIAFGAVGKFWRPAIEWRDVPVAEFASFATPGFGKIAANVSVRRYGDDASLLSYECRTVTTDGQSRRRFANYWRVVRPFVAHIMRATVRTIGDDAERDDPTVLHPRRAKPGPTALVAAGCGRERRSRRWRSTW